MCFMVWHVRVAGFWCRLSRVNEDFSLCATYPKLLVVPKSIDDDTLRKVADFRSKGRLPVLSYKHVNQVLAPRRARRLLGQP